MWWLASMRLVYDVFENMTRYTLVRHCMYSATFVGIDSFQIIIMTSNCN